MRNLNTEDKMFKLLDSTNEEDIYIAVELMKDYTFQDIIEIEGMQPGIGNISSLTLYFYVKKNQFKPRERKYRVNNIEIDIWQSVIFFVKR